MSTNPRRPLILNSSSRASAIEMASLLISKTAWKIWLTSLIRAIYALVRSTAVNLRLSSPEAISSRMMLSNDGNGSILDRTSHPTQYKVLEGYVWIRAHLPSRLGICRSSRTYYLWEHNLVLFSMESLGQGKLRCVIFLVCHSQFPTLDEWRLTHNMG